MNCHCHLIYLAFERSPFVNPQMCEHTLMVSATYAKSLIHKWTDSDRQGKQQRRRWHESSAVRQYPKQNWSNSLPLQQFQALFNLFSKSRHRSSNIF